MKANKINELRNKLETAISELERHPERFGITPNEAWSEIFKDAPDGEFEWDETQCVNSGDSVPWIDDDEWRQSDYGIIIGRDQDGEYVQFWANEEQEWEQSSEYREPDKWFAREMAQQCCYWGLMKQNLYALDCVESGADPLGFVYPERVEQSGKVRVTIRRDDSQDAELLVGDRGAIDKAKRYFAPFDDVVSGVEKFPSGRDLREDSYAREKFGWRIVSASDDIIVADIDVEWAEDEMTKARIRQVMGRDLENKIESNLAGLEKMRVGKGVTNG